MASITEKIEQLQVDIDLMHRFVQGLESETVVLGGIATPTLRNLVAETRSALEALTLSVQTIVSDATGQADRSEYWAGIAQDAAQAVQTPLLAQYTVPIMDPSGDITVSVSELGHPSMPAAFNPILNVLSALPHYCCVLARSSTAFTVRIFNALGVPGVETTNTYGCGLFRAGQGKRMGQRSMRTTVKLGISIPNPGAL